MRTFIAIFPPPGLQAAVTTGARETVQRLAGCAGRVRWTRPENVHLTLKFLGDLREEALGDLRVALEKVCAGHAPFDVEVAGLGAFPSAWRARVLWAGVRGAGFGELRSLVADLDHAIAPLGFECDERPYTPHLTLGRVRGRPENLDPLPEDVGSSWFRVGQVELVESTLTPEGAVYKTIGAFALREGRTS